MSTADQNCDLQLRELRDYTARRGWEVAEEYVDKGFSGAKASRPALDRLMADAHLRRFDAILVWKLDRFGRSLVHCISTIQDLQRQGVRFLAVSQGLDTDEANPASRLLLHVLAAVAEFERELIRERVASGMRAAKVRGTRSGRPIGRPKVIFPRDRVADLRAQGLSWRAIARRTGASVRTIRRVFEESSEGSYPVAKSL